MCAWKITKTVCIVLLISSYINHKLHKHTHTVEQNNVRVQFGKQLNIGIGHRIFLRLKIGTSAVILESALL